MFRVLIGNRIIYKYTVCLEFVVIYSMRKYKSHFLHIMCLTERHCDCAHPACSAPQCHACRRADARVLALALLLKQIEILFYHSLSSIVHYYHTISIIVV